MPAELPLVPSATALAISALALFYPRAGRAAHAIGVALAALACILPIALHPFIDPRRSSGRALWEWSAVGGPSVQASYHFDELAAVAVGLAIAFTGASLALAARTEKRHPVLAPLILALGFVSIALVITDDLVAAIVVLAVVAIITGSVLLAVAPVGATARAVGYLSLGIQAWVLAALLVSRQGSPTFVLAQIPPEAISSGAILAATLGALLFAGLYPVVAWSVGPADAENDPGRIGSLVVMPAGIGSSLLLLRLLASSGVDVGAIALPEVGPDVRLALVVLVLAVVALTLVRSGDVPRRAIAVGAILIALLVAEPLVGWAHVVLAAAVLTTAYAAVVSLAMPEQWEMVRSDLGLVALWIGIATASPLAVAGGVVALFARSASALMGTLWLVPHRDYMAFVAGSVAFLVGAIAAGAGAATSGDLSLGLLSALASALLIGLEVVQVARRYRIVAVPRDLDLASGAVAALVAALAAVLAVPLAAIVGALLPATPTIQAGQIAAIAVAAAAAVILARTVRPFLPYFEVIAERSGPAMRALDPAPIALGAFRVLEGSAMRSSAAFAAFERRGGVWLATFLIVALLVWAAR